MGQRVEIPEYTSQWQADDRLGEVFETQTKMQFVRGRVDEATGREEHDEIIWVDEIARVRLEGSGEVLEVPLADCFASDAEGNKYPAAKKWRPRYSTPKSDDWARQQWEEEITDMMVLCQYEIMEEFGRKPDEDGNWSEEDIAFLEKVCRERCPFGR